MCSLRKAFIYAIAAASLGDALSTSLSSGRRTIGEVRREAEERRWTLAKRDDTDPALLYPEYNFTTPIDHFHNESMYAPHSNGTYSMRYWFDATYYKPGGPVIVLQSGEADASARLPFLQKGLLHELAVATNGIGVVMEHRYYGTSMPTPDLSTKNLRFLTTEQALADAAYFAQNIAFDGLEKYGDLTSRTTAYLGYGGSYSGAFNAFLRAQYPEVFWECVTAQKTLTHIVDNILIGKNSTSLTTKLKNALGLGDMTYDDDFANVLSYGMQNWQSLNWDPAISSPEFYNYCANISDADVLYPSTESLRTAASSLISQGGYDANTSLVNQMLNYIGYVNLTAVEPCTESNRTQDQCFSNHNVTYYHQDTLEDSWRSWPYQYCTQWGYLQTGSGVPQNELPLISRTIDLAYNMLVCNYAFGIYGPPDTDAINKYGGYNISYPRLAIIDGEWDPWRPATPHAFGYGAQPRKSTASEPFILIADAVHHWDENGLFPNQTTASLPPQPVAETQKMEIMFVQEWMEEWALKCLVQGGGCS
ncbi:hypothetical protein LTR53_004655 [Teratosphaeriaceae sp. CCFEE 6253]|nr:hypothetical protein LTR53_004655 [Teratosphaeriaceae sp. CCFEE 6253]